MTMRKKNSPPKELFVLYAADTGINDINVIVKDKGTLCRCVNHKVMLIRSICAKPPIPSKPDGMKDMP